ncbi:MAG: hypothetical protein WA418_16600 [Bradyrhizobium sp.]
MVPLVAGSIATVALEALTASAAGATGPPTSARPRGGIVSAGATGAAAANVWDIAIGDEIGAGGSMIGSGAAAKAASNGATTGPLVIFSLLSSSDVVFLMSPGTLRAWVWAWASICRAVVGGSANADIGIRTAVASANCSVVERDANFIMAGSLEWLRCDLHRVSA